MTLSSQEFLRRFLLHVLPRGFVRIRFSGFLANRSRPNLLPLCQKLLSQNQPHLPPFNLSSPPPSCFRCPRCASPMVLIERLSPHRLSLLLWSARLDSS
jgi:hypothetical protein